MAKKTHMVKIRFTSNCLMYAKMIACNPTIHYMIIIEFPQLLVKDILTITASLCTSSHWLKKVSHFPQGSQLRVNADFPLFPKQDPSGQEIPEGFGRRCEGSDLEGVCVCVLDKGWGCFVIVLRAHI